MIINKYKYKLELMKRDQRIDYLERQLCHDKHKWKSIDMYPLDANGTFKYLYRCTVCGKYLESIFPYLDFAEQMPKGEEE